MCSARNRLKYNFDTIPDLCVHVKKRKEEKRKKEKRKGKKQQPLNEIEVGFSLMGTSWADKVEA